MKVVKMKREKINLIISYMCNYLYVIVYAFSAECVELNGIAYARANEWAEKLV